MVVNVSLGLRLPPSSPSSSSCLSLEGDGLQPANSVPSFVLCTVLAVSYVRAFRVVAIPQSGLLAQVSSLWLPSGHSGLILKKQCSPHLPAQPPLASRRCRRLRCCSAGNRLRPALGCMHLPGLSRSGSGTRVVLRGADLVAPAFCVLPGSE